MNNTLCIVILCCFSSTMHYAMQETEPPQTNDDIELSQEKKLFHKVRVRNQTQLSLKISLLSQKEEAFPLLLRPNTKHTFNEVGDLNFIKIYDMQSQQYVTRKIKSDLITIYSIDDYYTIKAHINQFAYSYQIGKAWLDSENAEDYTWIIRKKSFLDRHWYHRTSRQNEGSFAGALAPIFVSIAIAEMFGSRELRDLLKPENREFAMGFSSTAPLWLVPVAWYCTKK